MQILRDSLIQIVSQHSEDDEALLKEVECLVQSKGERVLPILLHLFTHLEFDDRESKQIWEDILQNHRNLNSTLGREVKLITSICDYFLSIRKSFTNPKVVELQLFEEANHNSKCDIMTGLHNRGYFTDALTGEVSRSKRQHSEFSLIFFDLDNFKAVNDQYGHLAGDMVLTRLAGMVKKEKRMEDTAARFGGEEILLLLAGTNKVNALVKADRIRQRIEALQFNYKGNKFHVTVSGGIASFPTDGQTGKDLIDAADRAMYRAKSAGKNQIALFSQDKRQYMRVDFHGPVKVQRLGKTKPVTAFKARSKDLSMAGMLFETDKKLEIGSRVQLEVPLNHPKNPLIIVGTVVRLETLDHKKWDAGISFLQMEVDHRNAIHSFFSQFQIEPLAISASSA
ncbi:MAG: diguanylate cyclase [Nitrospina sp.]|nr:diguanylate cyclase [Nitrospina sp.]